MALGAMSFQSFPQGGERQVLVERTIQMPAANGAGEYIHQHRQVNKFVLQPILVAALPILAKIPENLQQNNWQATLWTRHNSMQSNTICFYQFFFKF